MKIGNPFNAFQLHRLQAAFRRYSPWRRHIEHTPEPALRSELFSADQMDQYGAALAQTHRFSAHSRANALLARLADNEVALEHACQMLTQAHRADGRITPAAEWLLDNYYLIEEQIRTAQRHLPKGYSRELPRLLNGPSARLPRVYDIALETISHGDGRVDNESLSRFVASYQTVNALTLGELWAIPIMLRLALIENLRRVASRVMVDWNDRNLATQWADRMTEIAESDPKSVVLTVADMARSNPPMASSFVAELTRRLQGQGPALALALNWIEQRLAESGLSIERLVQMEAQQQAADQVSIGNSIGSLRMLSAMDWREFVEHISVVERILHEDPTGVYGTMDFTTRDHYRHVVERLARHSALSEAEVAQAAIALAREHALMDRGSVEAHVGFYLVDKGLLALERRVAARLPFAEISRQLIHKAPLTVYLGATVLITALLAWPLLHAVEGSGVHGSAHVLIALLIALVASQLAISLVNWLTSIVVTPQMLPRLDYSEGLPEQMRSLVVIPSMFSDAQDVEDLIEGLEVRFLANRDEHLHFALLTDFTDAKAEVLEQDALLLQMAQRRIDALNEIYAAPGLDRFFLFHRPRRWNPVQKVWMGYERKRGKLADLNALLRGGDANRFSLIVGRIDALKDVRYVIALDVDTQLPRGTARQFIGAMAHPLNRPVYDARKRRIVAGYAILQPRVGISLPSATRSMYARLFGSDAGIDPYTRSVSDVYQDLFYEGSFIGKGIYDLDAFEQAIDDRFPENSILSHDLVEGCYARSGLISDVQLYEEYPSRYSADVNRRHRWIRGDWQLLPWLLPWAPTRTRGQASGPLSALSRWKIFDNLRRSLVPSALLVLLVFGWLVISPVVWWTVGVLAVLLLPPLLTSLLGLFQKSRDVPLNQHLREALYSTGQHFLRALLMLVWLPHEALYSLDAVVRTLWRVMISRRRLLEWSASREINRTSTTTLRGLYRLMWIAPCLAVFVLLALVLWRPFSLVVAGPILLSWLVAPAIAWRLSKPPARVTYEPAAGELRFLRTLARKTWAFFETHVGPQENWLPPDNIQEKPSLVIAHRTSPTNMGLSLLANLAAYDFGYLTVARLLERTTGALHTMQRMERHRGHFYNWYDTLSLQPLPPRYISAVDSGNLAGHLLTLRAGLLALVDAPLFDRHLLDGVGDTIDVLRDTLKARNADAGVLENFQHQLDAARAAVPETLAEAEACVRRLLEQGEAISALLDVDAEDDIGFWLSSLLVQCRDLSSYLGRFASAAPINEGVGQHGIPSLRRLAAASTEFRADFTSSVFTEIQRDAAECIDAIGQAAQQLGELAVMEYGFLYDAHRDLLAIGYNLEERRLDNAFYDLLASEARLTSFVAIAQEQLPQESWFTLGRLLTTTGGGPVLLSWTGSMFEYLMPMLVMPSYEGTLLDQTCRAAVARQIEYGNQRDLPWGISESGYNTVDAHLNYQYRAFGVPGLGLKRGLGEEMVVAPYATALALMVTPEAACANLQRLASDGLEGRFGLYEAVDYTPARLPRGQSSAVICSFMAHHQGMSLLALDHVLGQQPMQKRFVSDPSLQATLLLLQERMPKSAVEYLHTAEFPTANGSTLTPETTLRVFTDPDRARPAVQLLSNSRYHVMVSSAGGGYSRCRDMAVTRWREDFSCDNWGMFCYLRDVASGEYWSATHQPTLKKTGHYEAIFSDARAEFRIRERDFDAHTEIVVSPEDDIELRRIRLTNRGRTRRTIEITSYAEVVLAPAIADALHPAFSNLFVQTELIRALQAIVCTRRPRSSNEHVPWMCHLMAVHDADIDEISYETDRARFIGRGRSVAHPAAMDQGDNGNGRLSDSEGSVLDPIIAIRCRITLEPEQSALVDMVTGVSDSRDACVHLIEKYRDRHLADRVFDLAWTHSQVLLRQLNASLTDAQLYEQMAASIIYANASLRAEASVLRANRRGQSGLWGQSISGDLPIVLLQISDLANIELVRQLVKAHAYWRLKGLAVDLVIWNGDHAGYRQQLQDMIMGMIASGVEASLIERPGGIFVRSVQQISSEDRILMQAVARLVLADNRGSLAEQIGRRQLQTKPALLPITESRIPEFARAQETPETVPDTLLLSSPYGGFSADGAEYVITLAPGQATPAPWVNVLANAQFGSIVSESGGAYTWAENAHEFRLTPWNNDPVTDTCGEAIYLRDEQTGRYWSPTPLPRRGEGVYVTRHGFGYSVFEHTEDGIRTELWIYVGLDLPVKFMVLKVRNGSGRPRRLSATGYVEWVLGDLSSRTGMHVVTESDPMTGALFARNAYNMEFPERVAFFDVDNPARSISGNRSEFLGRNGSARAPAAMANARLSGQVGAGLDPCGAIQIPFDLDDGDEYEIIFRLGMAHGTKAASDLVQRCRGLGTAAATLDVVRLHWRWMLGKVQVQTPDPAVNVLVNGWLMYQTIACRFLARSGYYQSGGAIGFRDQLQDSMAMVHAAPYSARQHLLLCAAHQFPEGDVQHWWHPPLDRGVRTRCSDDYLWLPLAVSRYVVVTGDSAVLDEVAGYIEGRPVNLDEESYYDLPARSELRETLYQHCVRAIEHAAPRGVHGLPLIGCGDWNDGMNRVGEHGRGESIWLGFFLYDVLLQFAPMARLHDDAVFAAYCESEAVKLQVSLEQHGWDGAWYRRAYYDDGTPMGSAGSNECQIDSIAQSWSVLSGAAGDDRRRQAMRSLDQRLVRRDIGLIQLLDPPFDRFALDPGYIKGYVPGVRENGGQYTHAAIWASMAFARLGDGERAWELLRMINPVNHSLSDETMAIYKVEPYVVAADVYAAATHVGRGGWSWYTGSAGWMYRLIVESLLGLRMEGEHLCIAPVLPADWPSFKLDYRHAETDYHITVWRSDGDEVGDQVRLDGELQAGQCIFLIDDGRDHYIDVRC
ncbi:glycoside hydrolase family 94 protein [Dyella caseinilytica]|uniref:Cyclic beta 1-2 glucan synthetase n=1 Tax=Dyella caseinilytica TaxID=1849581 RepID=A0ABX7H2C1_9GAMM|nr:glycoside hydrolase family 94 protein [Dyella caseinilytica]QRN55550.1 cyclic beta 1-2 glucan synthetase [Dyella caseinilytica]GGA02588.1 cyclic beta 1-2 glucan synthetase [Dyella caseinilytica]